jgi:hypothetical protein
MIPSAVARAYVDALKAALNGYEVENEAWRDEGSTRVLTVIYRYAGGVARTRPLPVAHWDEAEARPDAIVLVRRPFRRSKGDALGPRDPDDATGGQARVGLAGAQFEI